MEPNTKNICEKIIKLDRNIRFAGIVNEHGEVIEGGFQQGVAPLLGDTDEQQLYLHSLTNVSALAAYKDQLGSLKFSMTEHEKVTLMTFPLGDGTILCISTTPRGRLESIKEKVHGVIKEYHSAKSRSRTSKSTVK